MDQDYRSHDLVGRSGASGSGIPRATHVLAVSSGKGGVGKSNFVVNTGLALAKRRKRVLLLDADMGLGNLDILIGISSQYNLSHVLTGEKNLQDVITEGPGGIHVLPASSGVEWMTNLTPDQKMLFLEKMDEINGLYDVLLIDTGAGISSNVVYFNLAAQTRIVIVTSEPTSLTDAYALIKVLNMSYRQNDFEVVVNNVKDDREARGVYRSLATVADRFLDVRLGFLGHIVHDDYLVRAVCKQLAVVEMFPDRPVSRCFRDMAKQISQLPTNVMGSELGLFWRRMLESAPA